jgi:hypothetical protein
MAEFSGGIQIGSGQWDKYSLILRINEISYSVENNTSYVEWWVGIRSNTQYHTHNGIPETFKVSVNGTQVLNQSFTPNVPVNTLVGVKSGAVTISHDADGSKTISVSASFSGSNPGYYAPITGSCSGTVKLTTIPRASSISIDSPSIECGNTININGSSASKNFTHKIYATWNGKTSELVTIASGTTTPSFSYTIPTSWEKDLPNSTSGIATFTLETFSGSNSVGYKSVNATIKVRSGVVPSIDNIKITDANSVCAGIGQIVQSQSRLNFAITYSGAQGSTVTSVSTEFEGQTYNNSSFTTGTVQGSGSISYTTTIYDSRGRSSQVSGKITVSAYSSPRLTNVTAKRANSSYVVDEASGTYALLHFKVGFTSLTGKNATSFYIQYRASGASSWTKINSWDNNYSLEQDYKAGNLFTSATSSYEVAFGVKDKFMNDYSWQIFTVAPTYSLINFGKDGRSLTFFGQDSNQKDTLTVLGDIVAPMFLNKIFPVGAVYITYDNNNPGNFLGGTWERFGQGRTLVGEGTGNDGSTSMSFTSNSTGGEYYHTLSFSEMPAHGHEIGIWGTSGALKTDAWEFMTIQGSHYSDNKSHNVNSIHTNASGSGTPHANIQPYLVVFFWRRVK